MAWYINALLLFWELLKDWLTTIFITPFRSTDMLWLLVPVWISWFFAEFFQEKIGTSMGNALTNAVIVLWGSIDCTRQTVRLIGEGLVKGTGNIIARFAVIGGIFLYGFTIVFLGWKGNEIIKKVARIREVTYVFVMFVPIFYNAIPLTMKHVIAAILFFPVFYYAIELFDRLTPNPAAVTKDMEESPRNFGGTRY